MIIIALSLVFLVGAGGILWFARNLLKRREFYLVIAPGCRERSHRHGLASTTDFIDLPAVRIGGHRHRHVSRVGLPAGFSPPAESERSAAGFSEAAWPGSFLKVETKIRISSRLHSFLLGHGFASASEREALNLDMASRYGLPAPSWIAYGEDGRKGFVLIAEIPGAMPLSQAVRRASHAVRVSAWLGRTLARMHALGVLHRDLFLKHVLYDPERHLPVFVDWQRARLIQAPRLEERLRDLGTLAWSLPDHPLVARLIRICLKNYLKSSQRLPNPGEPLPSAAIFAARLAREMTDLDKRLGRRGSQTQPGQRRGHDWIVTPRRGMGELAWTTNGIEVQPKVEQAIDWIDAHCGGLLKRGATRGVKWFRDETGRVRSGLVWWRVTKMPTWKKWLLELTVGRRGARDRRYPEWGLARQIFHLENLGIVVPRVLARGNCGRDKSDSSTIRFLVIQPVRKGMGLNLWLRRSAFQRPGLRRKVFESMGRFLHALHGKGVLLGLRGRASAPLAIQPSNGSIHLSCPVGLAFEGKGLAGTSLAWNDLGHFMRSLRARGASPLELGWLQQAYLTPAAETQKPGERRESTTSLANLGATRLPALFAQGENEGSEPGSLLLSEAPLKTRSLTESILRPAAPRNHADLPPIRGNRRAWQDPEWNRFAGEDWADWIMEARMTDRFHEKQGRSVGRWVLPARDGARENLVVYLKRHNKLPWMDGLLARLAPRWAWSPALQEWLHLQWATELGVRVPRALAVAEFTGPGLRLQSCLAVEELTGMIPLHEAVPLAQARLDPGRFKKWKRGLIEEMARIGRLLHDRRCFHKDFYLCHFYIREGETARIPETWFNGVVLIDLHRLARHPVLWRVFQVKDLAQLVFSSEIDGVSPTDRLAFWRAYRGPGARGTWAERFLRRLVQWKWQRYRRHNLKLDKGVRRAA